MRWGCAADGGGLCPVGDVVRQGIDLVLYVVFALGQVLNVTNLRDKENVVLDGVLSSGSSDGRC